MTALTWKDFPMEAIAPPYRVIKRRSRYRAYIAVEGLETWDRVDRVSHLTMEEAKKACEEHLKVLETP